MLCFFRFLCPDKQKTTVLTVDECTLLWSGCRPTWASVRDHGLARGAPFFERLRNCNTLVGQ